MKTRITLQGLMLVLALSGFMARSAAAQTRGCGDYLLELESHVSWTAVDEAWKARRPGWVAEVKAARNDGVKVAKLLTEFESHMKPEAADVAWKTRRTSWLSELKASTSGAKTAKLLSEWEDHVTWDAVDDSWPGRRSGWLREVASLR